MVRLCVGYKNADGDVLEAPTDADSYSACSRSTRKCPAGASRGCEDPGRVAGRTPTPTSARVEELVGAPIDITSTGPDRNETIIPGAIHSPEAIAGDDGTGCACARFHFRGRRRGERGGGGLEGKNRGYQMPSDARLFVCKMVPRRRLPNFHGVATARPRTQCVY